MSDLPKHPMQPLVFDPKGTVRFRENRIVRYLVDLLDERFNLKTMNHLAILPFDQEEREHFAQLIGYSVGGYAELSYVSDEAYGKAAEASEVMRAERDEAVEK